MRLGDRTLLSAQHTATEVAAARAAAWLLLRDVAKSLEHFGAFECTARGATQRVVGQSHGTSPLNLQSPLTIDIGDWRFYCIDIHRQAFLNSGYICFAASALCYKVHD